MLFSLSSTFILSLVEKDDFSDLSKTIVCYIVLVWMLRQSYVLLRGEWHVCKLQKRSFAAWGTEWRRFTHVDGCVTCRCELVMEQWHVKYSLVSGYDLDIKKTRFGRFGLIGILGNRIFDKRYLTRLLWVDLG